MVFSQIVTKVKFSKKLRKVRSAYFNYNFILGLRVLSIYVKPVLFSLTTTPSILNALLLVQIYILTNYLNTTHLLITEEGS